MPFDRRVLAPIAAAGALVVAATGLTTGVAAAAESDTDSGPSVTCNGNYYDASYGSQRVSSSDVACDAAQEYAWSLVR